MAHLVRCFTELKDGGSFQSANCERLPEGKPPFSYGFSGVFPFSYGFSYGFPMGFQKYRMVDDLPRIQRG